MGLFSDSCSLENDGLHSPASVKAVSHHEYVSPQPFRGNLDALSPTNPDYFLTSFEREPLSRLNYFSPSNNQLKPRELSYEAKPGF